MLLWRCCPCVSLVVTLTAGDRVACLKAGPGDAGAVWAGPAFLSRCAVFSTGLPVVEGQDLERGGPASAGEVERAAGNRGAAGLHSAPTRHWYADALCRSLSFCLSVRPSASDRGPRSATLPQLLRNECWCCRMCLCCEKWWCVEKETVINRKKRLRKR